jgi:hypothetical protein
MGLPRAADLLVPGRQRFSKPAAIPGKSIETNVGRVDVDPVIRILLTSCSFGDRRARLRDEDRPLDRYIATL